VLTAYNNTTSVFPFCTKIVHVSVLCEYDDLELVVVCMAAVIVTLKDEHIPFLQH
jgi:hypothetical protein